MKKIVVFGSSGSIGKNTLEVIHRFPDEFSVAGLAVHSDIKTLAEQIKIFSPSVVVVHNSNKAAELRSSISGNIRILEGDAGLLQMAAETDYDIFLGSMVGFSGLAPTLEAVRRGKRIALANKETLVVSGQLFTAECKKCGAELIPVDSEHSAIFQCLVGEKKSEVSKLILTASGGPFLHLTLEQLKQVTVEQALSHPTWKMGSKITIDSASMMNKGLEVIEAHWLFDIAPSDIEVVVHPQSVIHSMVEFCDGSIKAQLSTPDMKIPIQYALTYPDRKSATYVNTHLPSIKNLTFFEPDFSKFRCLQLAFDVLDEGGTSPCILNASNEVAVNRFLKGEISFNTIPDIIHRSLDSIENHKNPDLETIFNIDLITRQFASII